MTNPVEELKKQRFEFLKKAYELSGGSERSLLSLSQMAQTSGLGLEETTVRKIADYLKGEDLIKFVTTGGGFQITHNGIKEMEEAISNPDKSTTHFPAVNIINIGHMEHSQIQQSGIGNIQSYLNDVQIGNIKTLVSSIKNSINKIDFSNTSKQDLNSEISTIEAQLSSTKPKKNIFFECLKSIKTIFEGVSGNVIAQGILSQIGTILSNLT